MLCWLLSRVAGPSGTCSAKEGQFHRDKRSFSRCLGRRLHGFMALWLEAFLDFAIISMVTRDNVDTTRIIVKGFMKGIFGIRLGMGARNIYNIFIYDSILKINIKNEKKEKHRPQKPTELPRITSHSTCLKYSRHTCTGMQPQVGREIATKYYARKTFPLQLNLAPSTSMECN